MNRQTSVTEPFCTVVATYTYDTSGHLASESNALSQVTSYAYNSAGRLQSTTNPLGTTTFTYDALGRTTLASEPDPDGAGPELAPFTQNTYDDQGHLVTVTTLDGDTLFEYDNLGRNTKVTLPDPDGAGADLAPWTVYTFDAVGNLVSETDRLGHSTTYAYDNLYRQTSVTDALSGVTSYAYDAAGNRTSLTDPVGNTTTWLYDGLNRVIEETNELGNTRYFDYDSAGNLTEKTDRNGRVTQYDYDNLHRRTEERWLDDQSATLRTLSFSYDELGQLTSASNPAASFTFVYDSLGRNTSVTHDLTALSFDVVIDESYDALGRRTSLSATIDGTADFRNEYQYDFLNRMTQVTQAGQSGGNAVAEKRIDFTYDADHKSQWQSISRYADLTGTQLVATSTYNYDAADRLTDLTHAGAVSGSPDPATLADYDWSYDEANRITQFVSLADGTVDYTYDDTNQLTGADYDYQTDESHSYDANGNRTNSGYSTGTNNQLLSDGTYDYDYDAEGNRTKRTEIATGAVTEYEWDHRNRLTKITDRDSETGPATKIAEYTYDIFGRRIAKEIDNDGDGMVDDAVTYIYDGLREGRGNAGDHIILAFDGNDDVANRYLHGPAVDQVLADEQVDAVSSAGDVLWPLTDNLGTVRDLVAYDAQTAATTVRNHLTYSAYGNISSETDGAVDHIFTFTGREHDGESDLQFNRARYYDPYAQRWISEDPIGFTAGDTNPQRYVTNAPVNATDPSGLEPPAIPEIGPAPPGAIIGGPTITTRVRLHGARTSRTETFRPGWNPKKTVYQTPCGCEAKAWYSQSRSQKQVFEAPVEGPIVWGGPDRQRIQYTIDFQLATHRKIAVELGGRPRHGSPDLDTAPLFYLNLYNYENLRHNDFLKWRRGEFDLFGAKRVFDQITLEFRGERHIYPLSELVSAEGFIVGMEAYTQEVVVPLAKVRQLVRDHSCGTLFGRPQDPTPFF